MLTKSDLSSIKNLIAPLQQDIKTVKNDIKDLKTKVDNLTSFTTNAFGELFEWTDKVDNNLFKKKIPQRIEKLEHILKTS